MKSIGINEDMHKRLRFLSVKTDKKIYELIEESINFLERKYGQSNENNSSREETSNIHSTLRG
jgi:hypothetical protein